jgi:hypothetical protein
LGIVTLEDMGVLPFYGFQYMGKFLKKVDHVVCEEFGGDCYQFASKYVRFEWFTESLPASDSD